MCCLSYTTWAQTQSNVNGLVTDFSGEPLIGVSILVKGTSNGTVTDLDGKFSLSAEMGNMLQISYVGYISQEIKVESNKLLRIIMEEDTKKLEEVVVVGYGTQKKVNLTGAVSAVSAEDLASKPVMSTAQALAGLAPGLSVLQTSGRPGQGATVKIRGTGTFSKAGTDPLVLIDGLSGNIDDVDPNDIQSISFLKDAASASIYGNRAANGVIYVSYTHLDVYKRQVVTIPKCPIAIFSCGHSWIISFISCTCVFPSARSMERIMFLSSM